MAGSKRTDTDKHGPARTDTDKAGTEAGAPDMVMVRANPALFKSQGQVKLVAGGKEYLVRNDQALEVSREEYELMRKVDVRGRQAVVLD